MRMRYVGLKQLVCGQKGLFLDLSPFTVLRVGLRGLVSSYQWQCCMHVSGWGGFCGH